MNIKNRDYGPVCGKTWMEKEKTSSLRVGLARARQGVTAGHGGRDTEISGMTPTWAWVHQQTGHYLEWQS